ncbi:unnamed protein product, partial [Closterium sp. NIES-54]
TPSVVKAGEAAVLSVKPFACLARTDTRVNDIRAALTTPTQPTLNQPLTELLGRLGLAPTLLLLSLTTTRASTPRSRPTTTSPTASTAATPCAASTAATRAPIAATSPTAATTSTASTTSTAPPTTAPTATSTTTTATSTTPATRALAAAALRTSRSSTDVLSNRDVCSSSRGEGGEMGGGGAPLKEGLARSDPSSTYSNCTSLSCEEMLLEEVNSEGGGVKGEKVVPDRAKRVREARDYETAGAEPGGAGPGGAEPEGAETWGTEPGGAATGGTESEGAEPGVLEPGGAEPGGAGSARVASRGASSRREVLSPQELREWFARHWGRAAGGGGTTAPTDSEGGAGAGAARPGGIAEAAGAGPTGGSAGAPGGIGAASSAGPRAAGAIGVGAADAGTSEGAGAGLTGAGGAAGAGAPAGSLGAVPAGSGGAPRPRPYFVPLLEQVLGLPPSPGLAPPFEGPQPVQSQSLLQPVSPLPAPSPYTGPTGGLPERRAPESRPASPARPACTSRRTSRPRPPAVPGTHQMALRPSTGSHPSSSSIPSLSDIELRWLTYLLTDLGEQPRSPPVLYVDNKAMLALCREHRLEHRTKHIALRYFLARELQQRGQLRLAYVASEANTADIFTKALAPGDHQRFCTMLGGGGFGFLRTAQSWQQSQQETFSPQVLSELFPQQCVTGSVEGAALGASEPAAALGASESAAALGARASPATGPSSAEALHTFKLDSGASRCFFHDCTTLTPLAAPVPVSLADPTGGPVVARASIVLPCPAIPFGSLSGLHLPTFSTKLVSNAAIQDVWVDTFIPGGQRVAICTCSRTGPHLATFTRRSGSSLYTLTTAPAQVAEAGQVAVSSQVSASGQLAASCSCRVLSHQTLLWHHRLVHLSPPRLHGMHSRLLVSGLPRSLPFLPRSPALPCLPCVEGRQRAAPHSSEFPPTTAPLQALHMDVWGPALVSGTDQERYWLHHCLPLAAQGGCQGVLIPWIRATRRQLRERFSRDFPLLHLHCDRGGEFSYDLLAEVYRDEGIVQSSTSGPVSLSQRPHPHSGGRGRLAMRRCFGSRARSPLFVMPKRASSPLALSAASSLASPPTPRRGSFTTRARGPAPSGLSQVDPPPLVEPLEVSSDSSGPAEGGDPAADDPAATRRSPRLETPPGFPPRPSSLPPQPAAVDSGAETAGVEPGGAETEGEGSGGAATGVLRLGGADSGGPGSPSGGGAVGDPAGGPGARQPPQPDVLETLSPQAIRAWIVRRGSPGGGGYGPVGAGAASPGGITGAGGTGNTAGGAGGATSAGGTRGAAGAGGARATSPRGATGAGGTGPTSPGGTASAGGAAGARGAGAGGTGGAGAASPIGARTGGAGAAGASGAVRAGGATRAAGSGGTRGTAGAGGAGAAGAGGTAGAGGAGGATRAAGTGGARGTAGAGGAGAGVTGGTIGARAARAGGAAGAGGAGGATGATSTRGARDQSQPQLPGSPLHAPAPHTEVTESLTERREPETRASTPVRARRVARPCPPAVPGAHGMALRPSSVPQRVVPPEPLASSLPHVPDRESDLARAASPTITRLLATVVTDPELESTAAFVLVTELVDFAARSRLDYVASLVTESESVCTPSVGGELALGSDVLEDRQFEFECLAAALPLFASMLLCPEGDPDALDIPTPRSYAKAIAGEYSSQRQRAMDAQMASWKSTGTYVDEVPPPGANIGDGMWIFRVKQPSGSPPAFKARYVA